jgi:hypothetical protein
MIKQDHYILLLQQTYKTVLQTLTWQTRLLAVFLIFLQLDLSMIDFPSVIIYEL